MEFIDTVIGPWTIKEWAIGLVIFGVLLQIGTTIKHKFLADKATGNLRKARCPACRWNGKVSKFHHTCPKCGNNIVRA